MTDIVANEDSLLPNSEERARRRSKRRLRDRISRYTITAAGFGVVFSLALIFVYLFYEVAPILRGATLELNREYPVPADVSTDDMAYMSIERYRQVGAIFSLTGSATFFNLETGDVVEELAIPVPAGRTVTAFAKAEAITNRLAFGLDDGTVIVVDHEYEVSFPGEGVRVVTPSLTYPFGEEPIVLADDGSAITELAIQKSDRGGERTLIAGASETGVVSGAVLSSREDLFTGEIETRRAAFRLPGLDYQPTLMLAEKTLRSLFIADDRGRIHFYDIRDLNNPVLVDSYVASNDASITAMEFLVGTVSIIIGTDDGHLAQWFLVRDDNNVFSLQEVRSFSAHPAAITDIEPEQTRKGFVAADASGSIGIHYGTSSRTLLLDKFEDSAVVRIAIPQVERNLLSLTENGNIKVYDLWNEHPQISFKALWNRVWYEGRQDPEYIWQSGSASDEFESKFSLVPLTIGTLKAAFFAMLFAMPLGLLGAIYTAYFMTPKLRGAIKPTIEIMEALPTVILGFLAGLWLAPFMENNLPAVFSILIGMPLVILGTAALWPFVPRLFRDRVPPGWEVVILIPVILIVGWFLVTLSPYIEIWFFDGSMRQWLTNNGITYDQRNAMVVGVAMGFAVIPTIYSIAEDAVFNVPKHLTQGSLALGATSWQTVVGVVLPTASPGMFSALMIGFGRAIGETMIVLMATGNSPVTNFNIFEGMRTLSANIAVELPETAVGSSHFRILFLAALVLFVLTFVLNTIAEIVRQRLRRRYSSL